MPSKSPEDPTKYLGTTTDMKMKDIHQEIVMLKKAQVFNEQFINTFLLPHQALQIYNTNFVSQIQYPMTVSSIENYDNIQSPTRYLLLKKLNLPKTTSKRTQQAPKQMFGFGITPFQNIQNADKITTLAIHIRVGDSIGQQMIILIKNFNW